MAAVPQPNISRTRPSLLALSRSGKVILLSLTLSPSILPASSSTDLMYLTNPKLIRGSLISEM